MKTEKSQIDRYKQFFNSAFILLLIIFTYFPYRSSAQKDQSSGNDSWVLNWHDEFEYEGTPDNSKWAVIHHKNGQAHKDMAIVEDNCLQLSIKKIDDKWRAGLVMTAPSVGNYQHVAIDGGHDRKMFAPPPGGRCKIEIKFRGLNAKDGGPMFSGLHSGMWLYSNDTKVPELEGTKYDFMRGEIDMIEHTSAPGVKPWIQSIHIHHFEYYYEEGRRKRNNDRSFQASITPTGPGERGYWGDTSWHVLSAEWGEDGVYTYMDGQLISKRTSTEAPKSKTEDGREIWGTNMTGLYFPFDEKFPLGLWLGSCIWTEPGKLWGGGIGPGEGEETDYDCFPFTMYYDYVRFYTKSN